jgi:hypothetical protein
MSENSNLFENSLISKKTESLFGKKDDNLEAESILKILIKEIIKYNVYSKRDNLVYSAFEHDDELMLILRKSELNAKNINSEYTDKLLKALIEGFKILNMNENNKRNPIMRYLKHQGL